MNTMIRKCFDAITNKLTISILILLCFACSTSDDSKNSDNGDDSSNFSLTLTASSTINVDTVFEVTVSTNEPMQSLEVSPDNFQTSIAHFDNLGPRYRTNPFVW